MSILIYKQHGEGKAPTITLQDALINWHNIYISHFDTYCFTEHVVKPFSTYGESINLSTDASLKEKEHPKPFSKFSQEKEHSCEREDNLWHESVFRLHQREPKFGKHSFSVQYRKLLLIFNTIHKNNFKGIIFLV